MLHCALRLQRKKKTRCERPVFEPGNVCARKQFRTENCEIPLENPLYIALMRGTDFSPSARRSKRKSAQANAGKAAAGAVRALGAAPAGRVAKPSDAVPSEAMKASRVAKRSELAKLPSLDHGKQSVFLANESPL
jgi:hypothetical protein